MWGIKNAECEKYQVDVLCTSQVTPDLPHVACRRQGGGGVQGAHASDAKDVLCLLVPAKLICWTKGEGRGSDCLFRSRILRFQAAPLCSAEKTGFENQPIYLLKRNIRAFKALKRLRTACDRDFVTNMRIKRHGSAYRRLKCAEMYED